MSLNGWKTFTQTDFGGAWTLPDPPDVTLEGALLARNVEFTNGQVATRTGFNVAYANGALANIHSIFNWLSDQGNLVFYKQPGTGIRYFDVTDAGLTQTTVVAIGAGQVVYTKFADAGSRLIVSQCQYDATASPTGYDIPYVISKVASVFVGDYAFPPPLTYTPSAPTEPGVGVVTAGSHRLGYVIEYRSGFVGRPSPDNGAALGSTVAPTLVHFNPLTFVSAGAKNLQWVLNPGGGWPTDALFVSVVMSPVNNPNQYFFVPGARYAASGSVTTTINVSDDDLIAANLDATLNTRLLTRYTGGNGFAPQPWYTETLNARAFYITSVFDSVGSPYSVAYISDQYNYQAITADQHIVTLPGRQKMTTVFGLHGQTVYIVGPHWTYATTDDGGLPVNWPTPSLVDGGKGTRVVNGIKVAPSGDYALVADASGLYVFRGTYDTLPISYLQTPQWRQIDWNTAPYFFSLENDTVNKKIYVAAVFRGASTASLMTWDYTNGLTPETVKFSLDDIKTNGSPFSVASIAMVQNDLAAMATPTRVQELWMSANGGVPIIRKTSALAGDSNLYRDTVANAQAIQSVYEPPIHPSGGTLGRILRNYGAHFRTTGSGTLPITMYSYDKVRNVSLPSITLAASPDAPVLCRGYMLSPGVIFHLETNTVDTHWMLSSIESLYSPGFASHR